MPAEQSRFEEISRRAFLRRAAALGVATAIPSALLAACGSDAETFASTTASTASTTATSTAAVATTAVAATTESTATTTAASRAMLPDGAELVVDFTYEADSNGGVKNPYVAVWLEDEAGELVATIALWFLQSQKGLKWLSDLRRWATVDGSDSTIDAISSATRAPGSYQVAWDGTSIDGSRAPQGTYYIAIEAAREHGPYSLVREPVTITAEAFSQELEPEGELTDAAVTLVIA